MGERYDYWIKLLEESVQEFHLKKSGISDDERYEKRREKAIADDKKQKKIKNTKLTKEIIMKNLSIYYQKLKKPI